MISLTKKASKNLAPEYGVAGKAVAAIIVILVIACMLLSGFGNIATWTAGLDGVDYAIAFGTGIISEVIGAVLLVVLIWCLARPNIQRLLIALLFLPVWTMATFQNASASWSYYVEASNADEVALAQKNALRQQVALETQAGLAQERILEIKKELSFIGMTRTPDEIRAERDRLPENYVTKRAKLTAELNKAKRRIALDTELTEQRATVSDTAGAGVVADIESSNSISSSASNNPLSASEIHDVWSFMKFVQKNRLGSLVMVMEIMKSFGLLLINVVFARDVGRKLNEEKCPSCEHLKTKLEISDSALASTVTEKPSVAVTEAPKTISVPRPSPKAEPALTPAISNNTGVSSKPVVREGKALEFAYKQIDDEQELLDVVHEPVKKKLKFAV